MLEWIMDAEQEEPTFLIRRDFAGQLKGWQRADVSGVVDALGDVAYAMATGEEEDTLTVFVLTDVVPTFVKVAQVLHAPISKVEISLAWVDPVTRKARKLTGYRNTFEV